MSMHMLTLKLVRIRDFSSSLHPPLFLGSVLYLYMPFPIAPCLLPPPFPPWHVFSCAIVTALSAENYSPLQYSAQAVKETDNINT